MNNILKESTVQPKGLYTDGKYLIADYNDKINIIDLNTFKIIKTIIDLNDIKKLRTNMIIASISNTHDNNKFITESIRTYVKE